MAKKRVTVKAWVKVRERCPKIGHGEGRVQQISYSRYSRQDHQAWIISNITLDILYYPCGMETRLMARSCCTCFELMKEGNRI